MTSIPTSTPVPTPATYTSKAPATLLLGPPGSGKTTALVTYLKAGLELFVLGTDPGFQEALIDACIREKLPLNNLHWHYIPAGKVKWDTVKQVFTNINNMSQSGLSGMKAGINKQEFRQLLDVVEAFSDFPCDRTGKTYGAINTWGPDRVLAVDSMTGINKMAKRLLVGGKPTLGQGEWGISMEAEELFIDILTSNTFCHVCCTAHIEKELDEVQGKPIIMASFLGRKLAPKIPGMFSDVILAVKDGTNFKWSTALQGVDLKARTLPISDNLRPSFEQVVDGWKKREAAIQAAMETSNSSPAPLVTQNATASNATTK